MVTSLTYISHSVSGSSSVFYLRRVRSIGLEVCHPSIVWGNTSETKVRRFTSKYLKNHLIFPLRRLELLIPLLSCFFFEVPFSIYCFVWEKWSWRVKSGFHGLYRYNCNAEHLDTTEIFIKDDRTNLEQPFRTFCWDSREPKNLWYWSYYVAFCPAKDVDSAVKKWAFCWRAKYTLK